MSATMLSSHALGENEAMDWAGRSAESEPRMLLREEIQVPACAARVQKIMEYASSDIRFDVPLAEACFEDRQEFCASVPHGSARVIRCLQDRRAAQASAPSAEISCACLGCVPMSQCSHVAMP